MNGVPNNTASDTYDVDNNDGKDFVGRIFTTPFEIGENRAAQGSRLRFRLKLDGAMNAAARSSYKTYGASTGLSYASERRRPGCARVPAASLLLRRPLGLMAEYAQDEDSLNRIGTIGTGALKKPINRTDTFTDTGLFRAGLIPVDR